MRSIILCIVSIFICFGCEEVKKIIDDKLTEGEVGEGLKEALTIGCNVASTSASRDGGFLDNPLIRIALPPEAQTLKSTIDGASPAVKPILQALGFNFDEQFTAFEKSINNAAEEAAKTAFTVFAEAVTEMDIKDAFNILNADTDTAAMNYMRIHTTAPLKDNFKPIVQAAINRINVTSYWNPVVNKYNEANAEINRLNSLNPIPALHIPNLGDGDPMDPDLDNYITGKAVHGLMILIGEQEEKIRNNPAEQVSELLKKVFGKK